MHTQKNQINEWQKYSQNTTIFISYEWVDHIAVYNLQLHVSAPMAIVRLYYFLLKEIYTIWEVLVIGDEISFPS
jgi:hypothetical protein